MKHLLLLIILSLLLQSCNKPKEVRSPEGSIDVITNVYFNASKNLDDYKQFYIAKINYRDSDIVEFTPNLQFPEIIDSVYYIKDSTYFSVGNVDDAKSLLFSEKQYTEAPKPVSSKMLGAKWINIPIYHYEKRKDISDTTLYNSRSFSRFEISTEDNYAIYYVHKNDTILPYSLNPMADRDYKGRIERIDSYDKVKDIFTSIVLIPRAKIDDDALGIFQYNAEIETKFQNAKNER